METASIMKRAKTLLWPKLFDGYVFFPRSEHRKGSGLGSDVENGDGWDTFGYAGDRYLSDTDWYYDKQTGVGAEGGLDGDSV